jgi:hypothetical protein
VTGDVQAPDGGHVMSESTKPMPEDGVVWCQRCERWSRMGQPYEMVAPGKFQHVHCPGKLSIVRSGGDQS